MNSLTIKSLAVLGLIFMMSTPASAQYCRDGKCSLTSPYNSSVPYGVSGSFAPGYGSISDSSRLQQSQWQMPAPSGVRDSATRQYDRPYSGSNSPALSQLPFGRETDSNRWNANPDGRFDWNQRQLANDRLDWRTQSGAGNNGFGDAAPLPDPFRLPALLNRDRGRDFGYPADNRFDSATQTRYRIPLDQRGYPQAPVNNIDSRDFKEQYVPVPLPGRADDDEARKIFDSVTQRYQNPALIRSLRSMSGPEAQRLFAEVARKIDERALEPSSYDVRTRRALRNIGVALDNPTFRSALNISGDSFRLDGLRNTLSRIGNSTRIEGFQDASSAMVAVMRDAQSVSGISDAVIAYEFANAQVDTLDKFSALEPLDPVANRGAEKEQPVQSAALEDEIFGIGVEVKEDKRGLLVVKPLRNSPAHDAGLEPGDLILAINGQPIQGLPMTRSVDMLKTSPGQKLNLRVLRSGKGERDFALSPRRIRIYSVDATRLLPGSSIGYLSLSRFSQKSTSEMDAALNQLHSQGMKSLIIDLRGNPGGLLTTCVEISDRFLPCGTIVTTKGRLDVDNMQETATYSRTWSTPLVVLVDGDSASASEIFAAAVQENRRGIVVGTRSYGKGSVQTHFPMNSASANLRLTTALFYSPNGRRMAGEGVTPDVLINDADGVANGDEVLNEAVRIAESQQLRDLARAAGTCRPGQSSPSGRSSSLNKIHDNTERVTVLR